MTDIINGFFASGKDVSKILRPFLAACFVAALLQSAGCVSGNVAEDRPPDEVNPAVLSGQDVAGIEKEWGIRIIGIRRTAAGYLLDFRYRVLDPEKAVSLLDSDKKAHIIDQKSGIKLTVPSPPKIGTLRQSTRRIKPDRDYFILFSNPGGMVKPGMKVTVVIGDFRAENLTVQ